ncbi:hypothetical protein L3i22_058980 [Actinoplanes sp. L3-i22]|nr:hypothetical protein L3i22_058980 [Actinoplanes sp. L3-i22]
MVRATPEALSAGVTVSWTAAAVGAADAASVSATGSVQTVLPELAEACAEQPAVVAAAATPSVPMITLRR